MTTFLADAMLGRLAKWLRILGYDTLYGARWDDNELARRARAEGRVLLTRDGELARRRGLRVLFISQQELEPQLAEVLAAYPPPLDGLFSRCPECNALLQDIPKEGVRGQVPPYVYETQQRFRQCPACQRFYWQGTHWQRMRERLAELEQSCREPKGREEFPSFGRAPEPGI